MVNFFYNEKFYESIEDLMEDLEIDEENIEDAPNFFQCYESSLEPIFQLSTDWILDRVDEERFSEDDSENGDYNKLKKLLDTLDFQEINSKIPKLYYQSYKKFEITKVELYEALK